MTAPTPTPPATGPETGGQPSVEPAGGQQPPADSDRGFPENMPVSEMNDSQKAAYYKFQNRQTDSKLSKFNGVTPEQIQQMQHELEMLRTDKLSADEKALKAATSKAAEEARAAAEAALRPQIQAAQLKSAAALVIKDRDQLDAFMAVANPAAFCGEDGNIDEEKLMGHLTAMFGGQQPGNGQQQRPAWGQHSGGTPPVRAGEAGKAEALKRFGKST